MPLYTKTIKDFNNLSFVKHKTSLVLLDHPHPAMPSPSSNYDVTYDLSFVKQKYAFRMQELQRSIICEAESLLMLSAHPPCAMPSPFKLAANK